MLFCQAYPVKKMVPLDRLASASPCVGGDFQQCPLFQELSARANACAESPSAEGCKAVTAAFPKPPGQK